jgi:hypothetical protein
MLLRASQKNKAVRSGGGRCISQVNHLMVVAETKGEQEKRKKRRKRIRISRDYYNKISMHYNSTDMMAFDFVSLGELKCNVRN